MRRAKKKSGTTRPLWSAGKMRAKKHVPQKKAKSSPKAALRLKVNEEALAELIEKGRPRGFVTDSEIIYYFPRIEEDVMFLDEIYDRLEKANIKIIETGGLIE